MIEKWYPFATAPRDGTEFDIWFITEKHGGARLSDVRFARSMGTELILQGRANIVSKTLTPTHWRPKPQPPTIAEDD